MTTGDGLGVHQSPETYQVSVSRSGDAWNAVSVQGTDNRRVPDDTNTEIYKLYVHTAESNLERRQKINQYYFSVAAAIFVAFGFLAEGKAVSFFRSTGNEKLTIADMKSLAAIAIVLAAFLFIISLAWMLQLRAVRRVSKAKFDIIMKVEGALPMTPFRDEHELVYGSTAHPKPSTASGAQIEMVVPGLLMTIATISFFSAVGFIVWA